MALYAQETLDNINRTRTAVVNKTYESVNGNKYIGVTGGFLQLVSPLDIEEVIVPITVGRSALASDAATETLQLVTNAAIGITNTAIVGTNTLLETVDASINNVGSDLSLGIDKSNLNEYTQLNLLNLMYEELQQINKTLKKIYQ